MSAKQNGRPEGVPDGFGWKTDKTPAGWEFTVRELGVDENDQIFEAAKKPDGTPDDQASLRMALALAIVKPEVTVNDIGKWPGTRLTYVARAFNQLNSIGPNPSAPTTGSGATSPNTGESSPQS